MCALSATGTWLGLRPDPLLLASGPGPAATTDAPSGMRSAAATLRANGPALRGVAGIVLGHLVMVGVMSMTPVHMGHSGATLQLVGLVISLHVAGMYALSPVFGWLADRVGARPVLTLSAVLLVGAGVVSGMAEGHQTALLSTGLVLLGLGWSASMVAGSALVAGAVAGPERTAVQGLTDVSMNLAGAVGGIAAGLTVAGTSFAVLGIAAAVLASGFLALVLLAGRSRAGTRGAESG
jgi:MFS family permease